MKIFFKFAFLFGGVFDQCCFLGLMGVRNTWFLGVETRNKCLYVVNDQPAALQSLHEGTGRGFPEEGLFIMVMELCVCVFVCLIPVASVICLNSGL